MNMQKETVVNQELKIRATIETFFRGVVAVFANPAKTVILASLMFSFLMVWQNRNRVIYAMTAGYVIDPIYKLIELTLLVGFIVSVVLLLLFFGRPIGGFLMENNLRRIGLINSANEVPRLIKTSRKNNETKTELLEFETYGIPLTTWKMKEPELEATLNINISEIRKGKDNRRIIIEYAPGGCQLPSRINWDSEYLSDDDFKVAIGIDLNGVVYWDLAMIPHGLIGGSTGSGKTMLMKSLLDQCIVKGAEVCIADFKGGVDFNWNWELRAKVITEKVKWIKCLNDLVSTLEERQKAFKLINAQDIISYNNISHEKLPRVIMACDEIAAALDKTGASTEDKKLICEIEIQLAQIARLGRAFGIHLILGTQRPDATILAGQIRSNIDFRICGRADDILSKIILDNTMASEVIPKSSRGRFLTGDGVAIQGYYVDL